MQRSRVRKETAETNKRIRITCVAAEKLGYDLRHTTKRVFSTFLPTVMAYDMETITLAQKNQLKSTQRATECLMFWGKPKSSNFQ